MINISTPTPDQWKETIDNLDTATDYQLQQSTEEALAYDRPIVVAQEMAVRTWAAACLLNERLKRLELQPPTHHHPRGDK